MIKKRSEPKHPELYAKYSPLVTVFWLTSWAGNCFSGFTEYNGFMSDNVPQQFLLVYSILAVLTVEILWRYLLPLLADTCFDIYRKMEWWKIPMLVFLFICCCGVYHISVTKSKEGIKYNANQDYQTDTIYSIDSTKYNLLCRSCTDQYTSDTAKAAIDAKAPMASKLEKAKNRAASARKTVAKLIKESATWLEKKNAKDVALARAIKIKQVKRDIKEATTDNLSAAKAALAACMKNANDTLIYYTNNAEALHNAKNIQLLKDKDDKIKTNNFLMYAGVILVGFYAFLSKWVDHISGIKATYIINHVDYAVGIGAKIRELMKVKLYNLGDSIVTGIFGESITVVDREFKIEKKKATPKTPTQKGPGLLASAWAWITSNPSPTPLDADMINDKDELQRIELEKQRELQRIELEKAKAQLEKEKMQLEQQRREAEIKSAAELEKLKAQQASALLQLENEKKAKQAELEREKKAKQAELERERLQAANAALQAKLKREYDLKQLKQQKETEAQQLRQQLESKYRKEAQERLTRELEAKEKQLKQQAEELKQIKELQAQTARKEAEMRANTKKLEEATKTAYPIDIQEIVCTIFENHTHNGTLVLSSQFSGNIRNWYARWKKAEAKPIPTNETAKNKRKTAIQNNKNKYLLAVEKLKEHGYTVTTSENKVNKIIKI